MTYKIKFLGKITEGNPGFGIIQFAENKKNEVDMIIMGSRGRGHPEEILLGSVSYYVIHKSKTPVLIIK